MKRNWFARHPIGFMALYFLLYLSAFNFLETQISMPRVLLVHCRLDDLIPFCKYAILPYFAWFAWIPFTLFYLLWKAPREDFWRLCLPLFGGMTIALACYVILPTGLDLRPYYVPGTDLFARAVRMLYRTDTATNVCPSIHVFNSVTLMLAYHRCRLFEEPRRRWMRPAADVAGGSTLGNLLGRQILMPMVDIGVGQLAMHSAMETASCKDAEYLANACAAYYNTPIFQPEDGQWKLGL